MKRSPRLLNRLHCLGYFGFGSGYTEAHDLKVGYCGVNCSFADECMEEHRQRVRRIAPVITANYESSVKANLEAGANPFVQVMEFNAEDGGRVARGAQPLDRKGWTIQYPFERRKKDAGSS